jgi:hypothetical protein
MLYRMREYFQPEGEMEDLLVEKLTVISWRDRRVLLAECAGIEKERTAQVENVITQRIEDDRTKLLGIRWDGPNSITLKRVIDLLTDLRSDIRDRGFNKEEDLPILLALYSTTDDGSLSEFSLSTFAAWNPRSFIRGEEIRRWERASPLRGEKVYR